MKLEGKVCAVTGGASGLGEGTCKHLYAAGCSVAILDLNSVLGVDLARRLGPRALFIECDVTSDSSLTTAFQAIVARFGRLDVVITCAGIVVPKQTLNKQGAHPLDLFERIFRVNVTGTFNTARHAVGQFVKQEINAEERGVIVMVSSVHAHDGTRGVVAYATTKGAVTGMTLPMARDLGQLGIRVVTISPGMFATPMEATIPGKGEIIKKFTPLGRVGDPAEFAQTVEFAITNKFLTGCEIRLDGGLRNPHL